jgi:hypothetical protein
MECYFQVPSKFLFGFGFGFGFGGDFLILQKWQIFAQK